MSGREQLPSHAPFGCFGKAPRLKCPSSQASVNGIQRTHQSLGLHWLLRGKQLRRALIPPAKIQEQYLGFGIALSIPVQPADMFTSSSNNQESIVGRVG